MNREILKSMDLERIPVEEKADTTQYEAVNLEKGLIMTEETFLDQFWIQYLMIEKEFKATVRFLAIDTANFTGFSNVYAKILLEIGSEIDVVAKELCKVINPSSAAKKINQYETEINGKFPEFSNVTVACGTIDFQPWAGWSADSPEWWRIYNGVKHNRNKVENYGDVTQENFRFANQGVVLNALAGLYQLEIYLYSMLQHGAHRDTPLPGSRMFELKDQGWETKHFGHDILFFVENGCLYYEETAALYADV